MRDCGRYFLIAVVVLLYGGLAWVMIVRGL